MNPLGQEDEIELPDLPVQTKFAYKMASSSTRSKRRRPGRKSTPKLFSIMCKDFVVSAVLPLLSILVAEVRINLPFIPVVCCCLAAIFLIFTLRERRPQAAYRLYFLHRQPPNHLAEQRFVVIRGDLKHTVMTSSQFTLLGFFFHLFPFLLLLSCFS